MSKKNAQNVGQAKLGLYDDFLAHTGVDRLQKILARYELFKMIVDVPGDIVECGVFKGSGIYTLAKLQKLFAPNNERRIIGFDFFDTERKIKFKQKVDKKVLDEHISDKSNTTLILANLREMGIDNVDLIAGDVVKTTKEYAKNNPGFRISFLYLDVDNYEGTIAILKNFYPLVSPGGLVVFDEYAYRGYGESDAVAEYFKNTPVNLKSLSWANTPTGYIVKERF
ncbi:MAG: TylF/MycF/NovP-related O-methyltransferase [bacterium]|nr:TylF/MycF/NovP-related O-methyltransferase [bacterium]